MAIAHINDCTDANAMGRVGSRLASLLGTPVIPIPVRDDLEAAGNLVDQLDALRMGAGDYILANVAPRDTRRVNGSPFGAFTFKGITVVTTVDGLTLSLAKALGCLTELRVFDVPTVIEAVVRSERLPAEEGERIIETQFRSYEFASLLLLWLRNGVDLPSEALDLDAIPNPPRDSVWTIDTIGDRPTNVKLTTVAEDLDPTVLVPGKLLNLSVNGRRVSIPFYPRLHDVPSKSPALVVGSSGIGDKRFLEIVVRNGSAATQLGLAYGMEALLPEEYHAAKTSPSVRR